MRIFCLLGSLVEYFLFPVHAPLAWGSRVALPFPRVFPWRRSLPGCGALRYHLPQHVSDGLSPFFSCLQHFGPLPTLITFLGHFLPLSPTLASLAQC